MADSCPVLETMRGRQYVWLAPAIQFFNVLHHCCAENYAATPDVYDFIKIVIDICLHRPAPFAAGLRNFETWVGRRVSVWRLDGLGR
jgi:hypothetical protein